VSTVVTLIVVFIAGLAQAQSPTQYNLSEFQSGNENKTLLFGQKDILIRGAHLFAFQDGNSVNGKICGLEISAQATMSDTPGALIIPITFPLTSSKLYVDVGSIRTVWPVNFVSGEQQGLFVSRILFPSGIIIPQNYSARLQIRGNVPEFKNISFGFGAVRYQNIIYCNPNETLYLSENPTYFLMFPQKLNLTLTNIQSKISKRSSSDEVAKISFETSNIARLILCPHISGDGLQPSMMSLVGERGRIIYPAHDGCFQIENQTGAKEMQWTLKTDTSKLENQVGLDNLTIDFVGFPEPQYQIYNGNWYTVSQHEDLPKPIVLTYE